MAYIMWCTCGKSEMGVGPGFLALFLREHFFCETVTVDLIDTYLGDLFRVMWEADSIVGAA